MTLGNIRESGVRSLAVSITPLSVPRLARCALATPAGWRWPDKERPAGAGRRVIDAVAAIGHKELNLAAAPTGLIRLCDRPYSEGPGAA
jgi:hypothetical protein